MKAKFFVFRRRLSLRLLQIIDILGSLLATSLRVVLRKEGTTFRTKAEFFALRRRLSLRLLQITAILGSLLAISLLFTLLVNAGNHTSSQELLAEAKALWHMNEETGDLIADAHGSYDATSYNTQVVEGPFGNARYFNGLNSYIKTPLSFEGARGVTISLWVRTESPSQWVEPGEPHDIHIILDTGHDERNNFVVQSEGATYDLFSLYCAGPAVFEIPRSIWTHLVIVITPEERKRQVYLDGLKSSELISHDAPNFGSIPLVFGKWATQNARYFEGSMCEAVVWDRALSGGEIEKLSNFYRTQVREKVVAYPPSPTPTATPAPPAYTPTPTPTPSVFPSGVKALWHMDEAEGDMIADANGAYDATSYNTQAVEGPFGNAQYFNGEDSYIKTTLNFQGATAVTISLWVKPEPVQSGSLAIVFDTGHDKLINLVLQSINNTATTFAWHSADTDLLFNLNRDRWTHLVVIADATNRRLEVYQDGQFIGQMDTKYELQFDSTPLTFGKFAVGEARYFKGSMCEAAVWDRALSANEMKALFNSYQAGG